MANKFFSKSDKFKEEYCCSIIRVGEIHPIKGKDLIGYTLANGESIVVRKDQVKEGDVLIYASNETQLNKDFLSVNNLFEQGAYELNANAAAARNVMETRRDLREKKASFEKKFLISTCEAAFSNLIGGYELAVQNTDDEEKKISLTEAHEKYRDFAVSYINRLTEKDTVSENASDEELVSLLEPYVLKNRETLENYETQLTKCDEEARKYCGFFTKNGRVRAIKLGGVVSMGYLFSLEELAKYNSKAKGINLEDCVGQDFDTVDGELFVKAYVPPMPPQSRRKSGEEKRNKKIEKFNRMVKGEFSFHYDTNPLKKNIFKISPQDVVTLSVKMHGTSICLANVLVKYPIKLPFYQRIYNWLIDKTGLFRNYRIKDYFVDYGNVTSSRSVIKNEYINKEAAKGGYYKVDVWSEYGNLMYPYLDKGMTVYGEIFGYETGSDSMIQKGFDYGCEVGTNKLMPYRITTSNGDGTKREWEVQEVYDWTIKLIKDNPEIKDRIHPIDILYHGTLSDLYPEIPLSNHWHENIIEALSGDKKRLGMEKNEPMCVFHKVPREGICLRVDNDPIAECFKLKAEKFMERERKAIDAGEADIEMTEVEY